jgi:dsRNA-specific ribonuclease
MYRGVPSKILHVAGSNTIGLVAMAQAKSAKKMVKHYIGLDQPLPAVQVKENDVTFRKFLIELLVKRGKMKEIEAERYTDPNAMAKFELAMTHSSVFPSDPAKNYEMLEHLGDAIVNCITTWYLKNRFPDIVKWGNRGVQYLSKQKSLITSKPYLAEFAKLLGFIRFIRFRPLQYTFAKTAEGGPGTITVQTVTMDRSMEEDVFEAFFAALVEIIDERESLVGVGYSVAYSILSSFYDEREIPTSLNDLVDAKTQLKELFDKRARFGDKVSWITDEKTKELRIIVHFQQSPGGKEQAPFDVEIGPYALSEKGPDSEYRSKAVIEQQASRDAINYLQKTYGNQFVRYKYGE